MDRQDPCPWDWETALRKACKQAQEDGYRYRVVGYRSSFGWAWTYRPAKIKGIKFVLVHSKWRKKTDARSDVRSKL